MGSALRTFCCRRRPDKALAWNAAGEQQQQRRRRYSFSSNENRPAASATCLEPPPPPAQTVTPTMFEIVMRKQHNTLGFTIRKEDDSPLGYYVRSIKCEPALSDGRIRVGDRLHSVNGVPLAPLPYEQAILFIRSASETVWLRLYRCSGPQPPLLMTCPPSSSSLLLLRASCCDRQPPSAAAIIDPGRPSRRRLRTGNRKQRSASFSETPTSLNHRQLSRRLVRCNTEQNLLVVTNEEKDEDERSLPVVPSSSSPAPLSVALSLLPSSSDVCYEIITVELQKGWNSRYGFSLRTEPDPVRTVISEIHPGSLAARDGRLRVGDVLLMINDEPLGTRSTAELIELLRILSGATIITVLRHHPAPALTVTEEPLQQQQPDGSCSLSFLHESGGEGWVQQSTKQEALLLHPSSTR